MAELVRTTGSPRVLHLSAALVVGEMGRVCLVIWRDAVTLQSFQAQKNGLAQVVEHHAAEGAAFLCIVEPTAKPPDDALRKASNEMIASHGERLKCVAIVIEGDGFRAAVARSVISGMALLKPRSMPGKSFSKHTEALHWISGYVPIPSVDRAGKTVDELRKLLDVSRGSL